ncbi:unnamed protein product [Hermetia illucens]|uniref:Large ribosomal subunit protein mL37 n=1 Tax=Hermetia illucens TaxID=343691 RepID=A0A7R8V1V7_HERIL|nr:39S ribosomal protein L37, mitochondrial [Hermetia illucens]CAD7091271.1 unnamed protein product [Hermetia illucens]
MRLTQKLCAQHLDYWFKQQWKRVGQRIPIDTGAQAELERLGIKVIDAKEVLQDPKPVRENFVFDKLVPDPVVIQQEKAAYVLRDENVLLEGTAQAQVLLKTIQVDGFPKNVEEKLEQAKISPSTNRNVQNAILASHLFDCEQKKTAIMKVPEKPMFVLPRNYGITDDRKNRLIISKLLFECEKLHGRSLVFQRRLGNDLKCHIHFSKDDHPLQFDFNIDTIITSKRPLDPVKDRINSDLPDIFPLKSTISIPVTKKYEIQTVFPITQSTSFPNPHTIFLHFSPLSVGNLYGTPVTDSQFQARNMLKAFSVAAARAKQLYGDNATNLEKPVVVQSVHTDGKLFHFGTYQLNTLNLDGRDGLKNYWFQKPTTELFHECKYDVGRPILTGYNSAVISYLNAFYGND